ncbi:MAG: MarR family transcriptional regulator [Acidimicrobiales bacterium]
MAERDVQHRLGETDVDFEALAVMSNIFRVANRARYHFERTVLATEGLSFTAFTTLWVLWIWGELEARHLAVHAGITKGTLTGVVSTLASRELVIRRHHPDDRRLVLIAATEQGEALMAELFPRFNAEESSLTKRLNSERRRELADSLRVVLRTIESLEAT